ncbi:MAG: dephospho-CoA kinase [Pseudomonadota bacterium]|nr:dephospho-CoA kinase [Pseudomonadota bacterium]
MIIVGLTGSIAMGKSTLAAMFRRLGAPVFDADAAVHEIYRGALAGEVEAAFPGVTLDGKVDRERLSKYVVGDAEAMKRLEAIVHPAVAALRLKFLESARQSGARVAILDVPLLCETGGDRNVDVVVTVSARPEVQRARALARPGASADRFEALMARQKPDVEKRRCAHFVIDTSGPLADSHRQAEDFLRALLGAEGDRHA